MSGLISASKSKQNLSIASKMARSLASRLSFLTESSHGLCRPSAPHASCAHVTKDCKTDLRSKEASEVEPMMVLMAPSISLGM